MTFVLSRLPQTDEELYWTTYSLWGVKIPREQVCPNHSSPFEAFAEAYFARTPLSIWKASRGMGGKSRTLAYLVLTEAVLLGAETNILGGSGAQSINIHEAMRDGWDSPLAPRQMLINGSMYETRLTNGAKVKALLASQRSVRGPHPQRLRLDEIDEMDVGILDSAMGQPMPSKTVDSQVVMCVVSDTQVLTDRGEVPVVQVTTRDRVMTRKGWRKVVANTFSGLKTVVDVHLSNGRVLTCTDDHRIAVPDGWLTPAEMSVGQEVCGVRANLPISNARNDDSPQLRLVPSVLLSTPDAVAGPALTPLAVGADVGLDVGVSLRAVGLQGVGSARGIATQDVLTVGDRFEMLGIDTRPVPAEMIEGEFGRTNQAEVRPSVNGTSEVSPVHPSVASRRTPAPDPAPVLVDGAATEKPVFVVDVVASRRHVGAVPVYDLEIEGVHEFVAEGIVIHNSSTHQYPDKTMNEMLKRAAQEGYPVHTWCWKETSNPVDGWLTKTHIDRTRKMITKRMWEVEYDLQEPSFGSRAFDTECVEKMFKGFGDEPDHPGRQVYKHHHVDKGEQYEFEPPDPKHGEYVTGADWAKEKDWTVIATFRVDVSPWRLVAYSRTNRKPYPFMVKLFNDRMNRYPGHGIHDGTGLGNVVNDYLDSRATPFIMSGRARDDMLSEFVSAVENGKVVAPKVESAYTEHKYCSLEDLYARGKDFHLPDTVCAFALAWHKRNRRTRSARPILDVAYEDGSPWKAVG